MIHLQLKRRYDQKTGTHSSDESIHVDLLGLTDTMGSVHSLQIGLRVPINEKQSERWLTSSPAERHIPVAIEEHYDVRGDEVDTKSTGTGRQQEDKLVATWLVVLVDHARSGVVIGTTIDPAVLCAEAVGLAQSNVVKTESKLTVFPKLTIILQDVQHPTHLREDQDSRALFPHLLQESVQDPHLVRVVD